MRLWLLARAYPVLLLGWRPLRHTRLGRWWLFQLADVLEPWLYAPLPFLALIAGLRRDAPLSIITGVSLLRFALVYGSLWRPRQPTSAAPRTMRVMTANVRSGNANGAALGAVLARERPDVVAFQEIGRGLADHLATTMAQDYPYQVILPSSNRKMDNGMGVASRFPITAAIAPQMGCDRCGCQQITLEAFGQAITVFNVHPVPPHSRVRRIGPLLLPTAFDASNQDASRQALLDRLRDLAAPGLVIGDFNLSERQPFYQRLRQRFGDAQRGAGRGLGLTFPNQPIKGIRLVPLVRLDYIFHDPQWTALAAWTGTLHGSDHRYVVADLALC